MARPAAIRRPPDPGLQEDAQALHAALSGLLRLYQFRDRDKICCYDISVTQCHALEALVETGPLRSLALSGALMLDKSTTTRVVDALVRKGYVERTADPDDGRAVSLRVTSSGRRLCRRINDELVAEQAELLRGLDPARRAGAIEVLKRLTRLAQERMVGSGVGNRCAIAGAQEPGSGCG